LVKIANCKWQIAIRYLQFAIFNSQFKYKIPSILKDERDYFRDTTLIADF